MPILLVLIVLASSEIPEPLDPPSVWRVARYEDGRGRVLFAADPILLKLFQPLTSLQLSERTYFSGIADIEYEEQESGKPQLNAIRIGGEFLAGGVAGISAALVPVPVMYKIFRDKEAEGAHVGIYWGCTLAITYPLANTLGVYLVGNIGDESGSFLATLAGSYIGELVGGLLFLQVMGSEGDVHWLHIIKPFLAAPIGATIAFNLTRKYKSSANSNSQTSRAAPAFRLDLVKMKF